jgi:general stress protein YciG
MLAGSAYLMRWKMDKTLTKYLSQIGQKGGKAKGDCKRRSPEFYAELSRKGVEARKAKRENL